jgi:hypothetical protein
MEALPDFTTVYEKLGVIGTMLFAVFWLLYQNIKHDAGKTVTPDSLSKRLGLIEERLGKVTIIEERVGKVTIIEERLTKVDERVAKVDSYETRMERIEGRCEVTDRKLDRVLDRSNDLEKWTERLILMWDRHQERVWMEKQDRSGRS